MEHEKEALVDKEVKEEVPESNSTIKEKDQETAVANLLCCCFFFFALLWICMGICAFSSQSKSETSEVPSITLAFMDFTVFDINTRLSAKWNLLIRVPENLPGSSMCHQGDFQASLLYKNITIATSPTTSYNNLQYHLPELLKVSGVVSEEDINGAIGKDIMNEIKERSQVRVGLRLFLPDCRKNMIGTMNFACDEVKMQFDLRSHKFTSTVVGNPTCLYHDDHLLA